MFENSRIFLKFTEKNPENSRKYSEKNTAPKQASKESNNQLLLGIRNHHCWNWTARKDQRFYNAYRK